MRKAIEYKIKIDEEEIKQTAICSTEKEEIKNEIEFYSKILLSLDELKEIK